RYIVFILWKVKKGGFVFRKLLNRFMSHFKVRTDAANNLFAPVEQANDALPHLLPLLSGFANERFGLHLGFLNLGLGFTTGAGQLLLGRFFGRLQSFVQGFFVSFVVL